MFATLAEGDPKAPFSIATIPREGVTPFPGLLHFTLDPYLIMLCVKQGRIKYHFWIFGMTRPGIEPQSSGPLGLLIRPMAQFMDKLSHNSMEFVAPHCETNLLKLQHNHWQPYFFIFQRKFAHCSSQLIQAAKCQWGGNSLAISCLRYLYVHHLSKPTTFLIITKAQLRLIS